MKSFKLIAGIVAGLAVSVASSNAIVINFAALAGTDISFPGNSTFSFTTNGSGYQFDITSVTGGAGTSVGFDGFVAPGGPFTIGSIATNGPEEMASVSGTGMLHITDSSSIDLKASVQWDNITTFFTGGILDLNGTINLTGITYTGSNSDLLALAQGGMGSDVITFQFTPAESLAQLATMPNETSYSGSISVPEPSSSVLILGGLASLYCFFRFKRAAG